eukprot:1820460-Rhodomonas_salina.5
MITRIGFRIVPSRLFILSRMKALTFGAVLVPGHRCKSCSLADHAASSASQQSGSQNSQARLCRKDISRKLCNVLASIGMLPLMALIGSVPRSLFRFFFRVR